MTGHVFHRVLSKNLPVAKEGQGAFIVDGEGRRYLDASGGAVVVNLGQGREEIARAVAEQLRRGYYFHPTMFTNEAVEELADKLAEHAPQGISRFYFMTSGSEAVETAIKLARQVHVAKGQESRHKLISRWRSYHGLTLGALAATGRTSFRTPFLPTFLDALHIPPPYCLRCCYGLEPSTCGLRCAVALEEVILDQGPKSISAFIGETVSGASLAVYPPPPGYWPLVREICDRHGILLIQDEVMSGMGRTGEVVCQRALRRRPGYCHHGQRPVRRGIAPFGRGREGRVVPDSGREGRLHAWRHFLSSSGVRCRWTGGDRHSGA